MDRYSFTATVCFLFSSSVVVQVLRLPWRNASRGKGPSLFSGEREDPRPKITGAVEIRSE